MTNSLVIIGACEHTKKCIKIAELKGYDVIVYDDLKESCLKNKYKICNDIKNIKDIDKCVFFIAIRDNKIRKDFYLRFKNRKFINLIHPNANILSCCEMGFGNYIGKSVSILQKTKIGNFNIFDENSKIGNNCKIRDFNYICINSRISDGCYLGDNNFLCAYSHLSNTGVLNNSILIGSPAKIKNYKEFSYLNYFTKENVYYNLKFCFCFIIIINLIQICQINFHKIDS